MYKYIFSIALALSTIGVNACESCGCALSQNGLGIYPNIKSHFIGYRFISNKFSTAHPASSTEPLANSTEQFNTHEIWGRYRFSKKFQMLAMLPYQVHTQKTEGAKTSIRGLGDFTLLGFYTILNTEVNDKKQLLQIGSGVKFPTGKFDSSVLFQNFQIGSQSWDIPLSAIYIYSKNNIGFTSDINARINTQNANQFKFGNLYSAGMNVFYWIKKKPYTLLPNIGTNLEYKSIDYRKQAMILDSDNFSWNIKTSMDLFIGKFSFTVLGQLPIVSHMSNGYVQPKYKLQIGTNYFF